MMDIDSLKRIVLRNSIRISLIKSINFIFGLRRSEYLLKGFEILSLTSVQLFERHIKSSSVVFKGGVEQNRFLLQRNNQVHSAIDSYAAQYILNLKEVVLDCASGILFTPNHPRRPILESSFFGPNDVMHSIYPKISEDFSLPCINLSSRSYAHWLIEDLPRFLMLRDYLEKQNQLTSAYILVSPSAPKYVIDLLEMIKIQSSQIKKAHTPLLRDYYLLTSNFRHGVPDASSLKYLRKHKLIQDSISKLSDNHTTKKPQAIYISRRNTTRQIPNQIALEDYANAIGYQVLDLETLPLKQQFAYFRAASIIAGPHGAGLYNSIFAKTGTKVLDIQDQNLIQDSLQRITTKVGMVYQSSISQNFSHTKSKLLELINSSEN